MIFNGKNYSDVRLKNAANTSSYILSHENKNQLVESGDIPPGTVMPELPGVDAIVLTKHDGKYHLLSGNIEQLWYKKVVVLTTFTMKKCAL